jgi:hypothetical protein
LITLLHRVIFKKEDDVSRENLPHLPGPAGLYDELNVIRADAVMRRHAQRLAGDLAEDLLQQTWYTVARAIAHGLPIRNLRAYWYRVMVHDAARMGQDIARQGIVAEDPVAAAGPRRLDLAAASAEEDALRRLLGSGRRALLHRRRAELRQGIPAASPDPGRYRDIILGLAERVLAGDGPETRAELNDALITAYPEWFAGPAIADAARYQRRRRGREDVGRVLGAVVGL